MQQVNI